MPFYSGCSAFVTANLPNLVPFGALCQASAAAMPMTIIPAGCDWAGLPAGGAGGDSACCLNLADDLPWPASVGEAADGCGGLDPATCSVNCAVKLVPLVNGACAPLLAELFDVADGAHDGAHSNAHPKQSVTPPFSVWCLHRQSL